VLGADARERRGHEHVAAHPGHRAAQRTAVVERDADIERRALGRAVGLLGRRHDGLDGRQQLLDDGPAELARRQVAAGDLGAVGRP
jgi:hypothetical protein